MKLWRNPREIAIPARAQITLAQGVYDHFRQQVGWLPFAAFWMNVVFQLVFFSNDHEPKDMFQRAAEALLDLMGLTIFTIVFLAISTVQYFSYRENTNCRVVIAGLAMLLHGATMLLVSAVWIMCLNILRVR